MALPSTIDPSTPGDTDNPAQGAAQIRALKQYIVDVFGAPSASAVTVAPFSFTTSGVLSFGAGTLTVPSMLQGTPSSVLVINSQYSAVVLQVATQTIGSWTQTGLLLKQVFLEGATTMKIGTQNAQSLFFRTQALDRAVISPSGMLGIGQGSPVYPLHISGTTSATQRIQIDDTTTTAGTVLLGQQTLNAGTATALWVGAVAGSSLPLGLVSQNNAVIFLTTAGNAGINTITPTQMLHVAGIVYIGTAMHMGGAIRCDVNASGRLVLPVGAGKYLS